MPALPEFLVGTEFSWLAIDDSGLVGIFMTAGEGNVPSSVLLPEVNGANVEAEVLKMSERSECRLHKAYNRADDFVALARRGVYAYDWSDVHRTRANCTGMYELVAEPMNPITVEHLAASLQELARASNLQGVMFGALGGQAVRV